MSAATVESVLTATRKRVVEQGLHHHHLQETAEEAMEGLKVLRLGLVHRHHHQRVVQMDCCLLVLFVLVVLMMPKLGARLEHHPPNGWEVVTRKRV